MTKSKTKLVILIIITFILCVFPVASFLTPVQAVQVTLDGEPFVVDAWVIKDGGTYKMWYTHSRTDMGISDLANSLTTIISTDLISDFVNLDLQNLFIGLADIANTSKMVDLWNFMTGTTNVIGYA
ncbi:MAG: hypothetical protein JSV32_02455, partial [Dehalococcoidia bacterium]